MIISENETENEPHSTQQLRNRAGLVYIRGVPIDAARMPYTQNERTPKRLTLNLKTSPLNPSRAARTRGLVETQLFVAEEAEDALHALFLHERCPLHHL